MVKLSHEFFEQNKTSLKEKPELTSKLPNKHSKVLEEVKPINLEAPVSEIPVVSQQVSEPKKLSAVELLKAKLARLNGETVDIPEVDVPEVSHVPEVTYTPEVTTDIHEVTYTPEVTTDIHEVTYAPEVTYTPEVTTDIHEVNVDIPGVTDIPEVTADVHEVTDTYDITDTYEVTDIYETTDTLDLQDSYVETSTESTLSVREFNPTEFVSETTPQTISETTETTETTSFTESDLLDTRLIQFVDEDGNPVKFVDADGNPVRMVKQVLTNEEKELLATAKEDAEANPVVPNILPSKPSIKNKFTKKGVLIGLLACASVLLIGGVTYGISQNKPEAKTEVTTKSSSTTASTENLSYTEQLEKKLKTIAEKTVITEHTVEIKDIGGGYLLGTTTYYPDDEEKRYTDYTLTKPEKKVETASNETVTKIEEALKASLPTINETITIKDGVNLKTETYQTGDTYVTILLSDETPFAYVTSDAELNMVNHVTTYYVSDIAAS